MYVVQKMQSRKHTVQEQIQKIQKVRVLNKVNIQMLSKVMKREN